MLVTGLRPERYEYNFRIDGKIVQDPFACVIRGREKFGAPLSEDEHEVRCAFLSKKNMTGRGTPHRRFRTVK